MRRFALFPLLGELGRFTCAQEKSLGEGTFDWDSIVPSEKLSYTPCYDGFQCARLLVPLDWQDSSSDEKAAIAIITLPARVPYSDPSFGGTIITNPGGPGGSGVDFNLRSGRSIQNMVDGNKHYEIMSFDPRGVSYSTPTANCYHDEFTRGTSILQNRAIGGFDDGPDVLNRHFAQAYGVGNLCNTTAHAFMTTASVCRDMVEMVDRIEELKQKSFVVSTSQDGTQLPLRGHMKKKGMPRIQYYGFSYGTVLGNTFASMYPGRVGRMILDGVEDIYDYYTTNWALNLVDTEKAVNYFYETCFNATSERCVLSSSKDKNWQDIKARVDTLITDLQTSPAFFVYKDRVHVITHHDVHLTMFRPMYKPLGLFDNLARVLADALRGNFTLLIEDLDLPKPEKSCPLPGAPKNMDYTWGADAFSSIACSDGDEITEVNATAFASYVEQLKADSPTFGVRWGDLRLGCVGWAVRPKWRFTGPFGAPGPDDLAVAKEDRPAAPVMFYTPRIDPVTPLGNAFAMSKLYPGSVVVVHESVGHCSSNSPSACMSQITARYFETGELPKPGTVCSPDCRPWEDCAAEASWLELSDGKFPLGVI